MRRSEGKTVGLPHLKQPHQMEKSAHSLAEFALASAKELNHFGAEFISAPKYCSRSGLCEVVVARLIAPFCPEGAKLRYSPAPPLRNGSDASISEKEEGNERVEFSPQGETEQSDFSSDAVRGAKCRPCLSQRKANALR